jgi:Plasmid pRiA4b ORF-3-like protein
MIANIEPTGTKASAPLYHLKIILNETKPSVWRHLQVPGNASLGWLHAVFQVAMGWTNSHLHQFRVGELLYSDLRHNFPEYEGDPEIFDEYKTSLQQVVRCKKDVLTYEYDFGDSWHHQITVEKILSPDSAAVTMAVCLDGARTCPPEDCGGTSGYDNLLKILRNPKHEEHQSMKEWLGRPFDPKAFDVEKVNTHLRKLKWPRTTESQLRKVLMARDEYHE